MRKHACRSWFCDSIFWLTLLILTIVPGLTAAGAGQQLQKNWKILHVMSYHSPWKWTDDQFNGFKAALKGLDIEYRVFQMDGKRNTSEAAKQNAGQAAGQIIETWKPDLVYANDDNAQAYVVTSYINSELPFVFSGVNAPPEKYGFVGSSNITGVVEQEHFVETVNLLRQIAPEVKKIAVIFDEGPTWEGVEQRIREKLPEVPEISITSWDVIQTFEGYKKRILELQKEVDAIALLGIFTFKDDTGKNVPYTDVLRWTAENSRLPDFSFWKDRISYGTLCTVTVSGYEQGLSAGRLARQILVDGKSPNELTIKPSVKGEPVVSLARAKKLGITLKAGLLLTAEVVTQFEWEK